MRSSTILGLAAGIATAQANTLGFNYGNTFINGSFKTASTYEAEFNAAKSLAGTSGKFTSARIYTMIQGGTTNTPNDAIQAAISTGTSLLLGMWASVDQDAFNDEIAALQAAIEQYGDDLAKLVIGLSVGSEDLYRITPTGIANDAGIGQSPEVLVEYIKQTRSTVANTALSGIKIGHVDTWTAWVNGSNFIVTDQCDWLGVDSYPYFQTTVSNSIANGNSTFWQSYDNTVNAAQGKEVWVTETGWPVSGPESGQAVASVENAETYWQEVACALIPSYNTWWYTLQDALPTAPSPSFGILAELGGSPLYDLKCKPQKQASTPASSSSKTGNMNPHATGVGPSSNSTGSGSSPSASASGSISKTSTVIGATPSGTSAASSVSSSPAAAAASGTSSNDASGPKAGAAVVAGILAIFAMVAAL